VPSGLLRNKGFKNPNLFFFIRQETGNPECKSTVPLLGNISCWADYRISIRSASGLAVKSIVAIDGPPVRLRAGA
jgi:hypothetical protein